MKVVAILGSRNKKGQTAQAVEACLKGCEKANADIERFFLPTCNIERCRQCEDTGWGLCADQGRCVIEDDFAGIVDTLSKTDIVIFATPVYYAGLSESIKAFLDRLSRIRICPEAKLPPKAKPAIGICVAGGSGGGAVECSAIMEKILKICKFNILDVIPVRRQNLKMKEAILQITGQWIASGQLSE